MEIKFNKRLWLLIDDNSKVIGVFKSKKEAQAKLHYLLYGGNSFGNHQEKNNGLVS